jgi:hypothetical protein
MSYSAALYRSRVDIPVSDLGTQRDRRLVLDGLHMPLRPAEREIRRDQIDGKFTEIVARVAA